MGYGIPSKTATYLLNDEYKFLISFSVSGFITLFGWDSVISNGLKSFTSSTKNVVLFKLKSCDALNAENELLRIGPSTSTLNPPGNFLIILVTETKILFLNEPNKDLSAFFLLFLKRIEDFFSCFVFV